MASLSNSVKYLLLVCMYMQAVSASNQMVIYWGQNSAGAFTNDKTLWEKPLRNYCQDSSYDIIVVGFVYLFPSASGNTDPTLPGMNFANHCEVPFNNANPYVLNCTANIAPDITYCQQRGKTILLSFGGGVGTYGFSSDSQAITFANTVWNMFLGGNGAIRPFGNAIFDGVDLDIEGGSATGYISFIQTLRNYYASSGRQYYISAAPQCFYPDRLGPGAGTPLTSAWFDYIWIQFYNNWCGLDQYPSTFNFAQWAAAMSTATNPNVKLFIGAPASATAANSGYVSLSQLQNIATVISNTFPNIYGGIMVWDASSSDMSSDNFGPSMAAFVHNSVSSPAPSLPATTGSNLPVTTGANKPATTGRVTPSTTGAKAPVVTPTPVPNPTPVPTPIPTPSGSSSGSCNSGNMKCLTSETYSTCSNGAWGVSQSCSVGTMCSPSGNFIYCIHGSSPSSSTSTTTSSKPTVPAAPIPVPVSTTASAPVSTPPTIPSPSTPSVPSSSGSCTMGTQKCVGTNSYQTCGNGANGPTWAAVQFCQSGLSCHATPSNIYCY